LSEPPVNSGRAHPAGGEAAAPGEVRFALKTDAATRRAAPALPPTQRSRVALGLTSAAAVGRFELQVCQDCGAVQYPPREACHRCLSVRLRWTLQSGDGELLAETTLFHSNSEFFRERLPWRLGMVRLDCGPTVITHLHGQVPGAPVRVRVGMQLDRGGQGVLFAFPDGSADTSGSKPDSDLDSVPRSRGASANMNSSPARLSIADDKQLREMTSDPKGRQVLITDGTSAVGMALARACVAAGAAKVWLGHSGASLTLQALEELGGRSRVTPIPLDVTSLDSVKWAANEIAETVDIVINNAELFGSGELQGPTELQRSAESHAAVATPDQSAAQVAPTEFHRSAGTSDRSTATPAPTENDVHYFGLLRLTEEFGPVMRARAAGGEPFLMVWVNLLSIQAMADFPPYATSSASKAAAAYSLSQSLRAQMQPAGIRVVNVFPGPIADNAGEALSLPKIEAGALARAIVQALQDGVEDVYPGDVASEWLTRSRDNPKAPERETAAGR
jgi:NAD(P)-dependent dehydrogenase (short-subunit alcohol dehydrogenase family)/uncharacterized OB-fold protein